MTTSLPDPDDVVITPDHAADPLADLETGSSLQALLTAHLQSSRGVDPGLMELMMAGRDEAGATSGQALLETMAMRLLQQQLAPSAPIVDEAELATDSLVDLEDFDRQRQALAEQLDRLADVEQVLASLSAEVDALRLRNDTLAAALGACYLCFGEDPRCPECAGHGRPGSLRPDPDAFRRYVLPGVRRLQATPAYQPSVLATFMGQEEPERHVGTEPDHAADLSSQRKEPIHEPGVWHPGI